MSTAELYRALRFKRSPLRSIIMQIVGVGTDIIECARIRRLVEKHGELFLNRVFTEREIRYCQARKRATEHFAARWAAKEAVLKSLGTLGGGESAWTEIEVRDDKEGRPHVLLAGALREWAVKQGIAKVLIALAHCRNYATAYATALGRGRSKS